jgi:mannose-6-phosphate isomerase-like protein (cupin superfamily)
METVNLTDKFSRFSDYCNTKLGGTQRSSRVIAEVNDCQVKAVKLKGEFIWHHHDHEDELFLVVKGTLRMKFRDREAVVRPGEFVVVPKGVEHCPVANEEVHLVLIEPKSTLNTGNITNERTVAQLERI